MGINGPVLDDRWFGWVFAIVGLSLFGLVGFAAFTIGHSSGWHEAWQRERWNCERYEMRKFAEVGFLIFPGSGEISERRVCVEWRVTR